MSSSERFGYEWAKYCQLDPNYYKQFQKWVYPLTADDFRGRDVLDAGCGMGRNSYWAYQWKAGRIVAFDCDRRSVSVARKNLSACPNVQVKFQNIYDIEYTNEFDIAMSIGVIHHLDNPRLAINNLIRATRPGGKILIWVYGRRGNEWIIKYINPLRKHITSRLPVGLVHILAYALSLPLWIFLKVFLPGSPYLKQISHFRFKHVHSIVFDQLIPRVANYWSRDEALNLFRGQEDISQVNIYPVSNLNWTVVAEKK